MSKKARVAIIGAGGIAGAHCKGYLTHADRIEVVALVDVNEANLEADAIEKVLKETGVMYMSAHNQLFLPCVIEAKKMIDSGALGRIYYLKSQDCFRTNRTTESWGWRAKLKMQGGGELIDTGYHPSYRLLFLVGREPTTVAAVLGRYRHEQLPSEDSATVLVGFAGGVMIAASYWSLLAPAIEMSKGKALPAWVPAAVGFLAGGIFLRGVDRILPHLHLNFPMEETEGIKTSWQRSTLLVLAITLHNIPEGLAVGVGLGSGDLVAGLALMLAIGLQNIPEGLSVGLSLLSTGSYSRPKAYLASTLSGFVELPLAVLGAAAVINLHPVIPYAMGFAAGAMIFVVSDEIIPEVHKIGREKLVTYSLVAGVLVMLFLDTALRA